MKSINLAHTQITDKIRVSSAALYRDDFQPYWLIETWVFSDDPAQRSIQVVHGESYTEQPSPRLCDKARKIHGHIAANLRLGWEIESIS